jgi:ribosome-binding protein aMBF1 (putative translation factor)
MTETCESCGKEVEATAQAVNIHTGKKKKICRDCLLKKMRGESQNDETVDKKN